MWRLNERHVRGERQAYHGLNGYEALRNRQKFCEVLGTSYHLDLLRLFFHFHLTNARLAQVRVHWVYTTTGAMLWVFVRSILVAIYESAFDGDSSVDWVGIIVTWTVVATYCASNAMLLRVMYLRSMVSDKSHSILFF
jgi:hypothetical protein